MIISVEAYENLHACVEAQTIRRVDIQSSNGKKESFSVGKVIYKPSGKNISVQFIVPSPNEDGSYNMYVLPEGEEMLPDLSNLRLWKTIYNPSLVEYELDF